MEGKEKTDEELLREALQTPISQEEAEKAYADIEVRRCHLSVIRQKWVAQLQQIQLQLNDLDSKLIALELDKAVIFRRSIIRMGEPVGGNPS